MIYFGIFTLALLFNFYVILFGKKDLTTLKEKISLKKYLKELDTALTEALGDVGATFTKLICILFCIVFVVVNAITFLLSAVSIVLGTYAAKKLYPLPIVSNYLNKIATYINRLK